MPGIGAPFPDVALQMWTFATAMGLTADASQLGLGTRSQRYAAIIRDGVIEHLDVEAHFDNHDVSSADAVLAAL